MAIGSAANASGVNSQAGSLACRWQQLAADMIQFTNATGGLNTTALQALGFTSGDATAIATIISQMATLAGVYYGTNAQATLLDYDSSFLKVRGVT